MTFIRTVVIALLAMTGAALAQDDLSAGEQALAIAHCTDEAEARKISKAIMKDARTGNPDTLIAYFTAIEETGCVDTRLGPGQPVIITLSQQLWRIDPAPGARVIFWRATDDYGRTFYVWTRAT